MSDQILGTRTQTHAEIPLSLIDPNPYRRFDINPIDLELLGGGHANTENRKG